MPSIIQTFHKVVLLCARFFWFVVGLTLTTHLLESCLIVPGPRARHQPLLLFLELGARILSLTLAAANDAALLGLLREPNRAGWRVMWASVRTYTGVLFRLQLLIALIAVGMMLPLWQLIVWFGGIPFITLAVAFIYLVLLKYALAYPLTVDQQLNATQALKRSWEMTRGHFWYVLFCYLLMALVHIAVNQLFTTPWLDAHVTWSPAFFIKHIADGFLSSVWIILGWQMYLELKEPDPAPTASRTEASVAPPNS